MRKVTIEELLDATRGLSLVPKDQREATYHRSYPYLLRFFRSIDTLDVYHLVVGAHLVYGWMPRVLVFKAGNFDEVVGLLNQVKSGIRIPASGLEKVKGLIDKSLAAASKVLHFVNPSLYPMWDSNVASYLDAKSDSVGDYVLCVRNCDELIADRRFSEVQRFAEEGVGYPVSPFRAVELVMRGRAKSLGRALTAQMD